MYNSTAKVTVTINSIANMDVYISQGSSLKLAENVVESIQEGVTYSLSVADYTYIIVAPNVSTPDGNLSFSHRVTEEPTEILEVDEEGNTVGGTLDDLFSGEDSTLWIIIAAVGGVVLIVIIVIIVVVCCKFCCKSKNQKVFDGDDRMQTHDNEKESARWMKSGDTKNAMKGQEDYGNNNNYASAYSKNTNPSQFGMDYGYD